MRHLFLLMLCILSIMLTKIVVTNNILALACIWRYLNERDRLEEEERPRKRPRLWMSLQSVTPSWYDNVLMKSVDDKMWLDNFRLPERLVDRLCDELVNDMAPSEFTVRDPIPLKKRICIGLYKLASCGEYRVIAKTFGVSPTSVHRCVYLLCNALVRRRQQYITWYTTDEAVNIAQDVRAQYGYPQSIGAIDGSHIAITPPKDGLADFICRKQYPSIVLQAVVDNKYKFRDIYCNSPGSAHDAAIFQNSPLSTFIHQRMPKNDIMLNEIVIPLHILGDPAYPHSNFIQKGYTGRNLSREQESFNVYHSSARMCVEIAFGRLKSRWRMCQKRMDVEHTFAPMVITACCILHNFCEDSKVAVPIQEGDLFPQPNTDFDISGDSDSRDIRDAIKDHLAANFPLRRPFHV